MFQKETWTLKSCEDRQNVRLKVLIYEFTGRLSSHLAKGLTQDEHPAAELQTDVWLYTVAS